MLEKELERKFTEKVKQHGGKTYKFSSPSTRGVPDRLVMFPGGNISFTELKVGGNTLTPLQKKQIETLKNFGCRVYVLDDTVDLDKFVEMLKRGDSK